MTMTRSVEAVGSSTRATGSGWLSSDASTAERVAELVERVGGGPLPVRLRAWDGSEAGPADPPATVVLRSRRALRSMMWHPGELGVARAYVAGDLDVEVPDLLDVALADPRLERFGRHGRDERSPSWPDRIRLVRDAARLGVVGLPPRPPIEEARLSGRRHSRTRDAAAISHHYDVGNEFYRLLLGESMVYSCGYWRRDPCRDYTVTDAQHDKLELVCGKLGLQPGQRLLDVGCGWGSLVLHAAIHHGVHAVGITLSAEQADLARARVAAAGMTDLVQIRVQDYREIADGPYDAIASVGMAEHLGKANYPTYATQIRRLLRPGGRLLHHQITTARPTSHAQRRQRFIDRYIFPDGQLLPLGQVIGHLEAAGLEARDVESLREHYTYTLRAWLTNLESDWLRAIDLTSPAKARAWRLYLAGSAAAFATNRISVHQILAVNPCPDGTNPVPIRRTDWLPVLSRPT
jgi:cyclopropane-fatty-acyl-phospholipid synthase